MVSSLAFLRRRRDEASASTPVLPVDSSHPEGESDDDDEAQRKVDRWWRVSSFELRRGLEVSEQDTVPAEFFDELFPELAPEGRPSRPTR